MPTASEAAAGHPLHRDRCAVGHLLLQARSLVVGHGGRALLPPLDLEVRCGEFLAVAGRNGSGKTTLFRTLLGLLPAVAGRVERAPGGVAYVPQRLAFDDLYPVTAGEVVAMGTVPPGILSRRPAARDRVATALEEVGAPDLAGRTFRSLSEGQKQKVLLARVLASGAKLVFLDEPTAAMDAVAEREAMALLAHLQERHNMALVVVTHHLAVAFAQADRVLFLDADTPATVLGTPREVAGHPAFTARYRDLLPEVADG